MNLENVKEFISLAKAEGVSELKYEEKDIKISVNFNTTVAAPAIQYSHNPPIQGAVSEKVSDAGASEDLHIVTSPFVGTYYRQPAPGKPAYVNIGDRISTGQTLCVLEAMKIMNEIESDVAGEIVEVCVENESLVEFGQPLFKVRV